MREEERARIAREIHDELGQVLTGLKMEVGWLQKRLRDGVMERRKMESEQRKAFAGEPCEICSSASFEP